MTGLLITFVCGILTGTIGTWWTLKLRDRRTRRMIARALIPDLKNLCGAMIFMGGPPVKWDSVEFPTANWPKYHDALAEAISRRPAGAKEWLTISGVFEEVRDIGEEARDHHQWPEELDDRDQQRLEALYQAVRQALAVLHRYAGVPKRPRRVRRLRRRQRLRELLHSLRPA